MVKLKRKFNPSPRRNYQEYKPELRMEFDYSCCWCDISEFEAGGVQSLSVEHYKHKNRFPELRLDYENLLYACNRCNGHKSTYEPSIIQRWMKKVILNPYLHDYELHLNRHDSTWLGTSTMGVFNIERLHLNTKRLIELRKDRGLYDLLLNKALGDVDKKLDLLEKARARGPVSLELELQQSIEESLATARMLYRRLNRWQN